jgi:hypothetical protein
MMPVTVPTGSVIAANTSLLHDPRNARWTTFRMVNAHRAIIISAEQGLISIEEFRNISRKTEWEIGSK